MLRAAQLSKANKKSRTDGQYRYYVFNAQHPRAKNSQCLETSIFSQDLFDSISVLSANVRELQSDRFRSTGTVLDTESKECSDKRQHRNLLHTLSQLRLECYSRSKLLKANAPELQSGLKTDMSQKQQKAKVYRDSQLLILETATLLCRYCLLKAQNPQEQDGSLIASAAEPEQNLQASKAMNNLQELVRRTPCRFNVQALFTFYNAIELLPPKLASRICKAGEVLCNSVTYKLHSSSVRHLSMNEDIQEKIKFTVLLATLRKVYTSRSMVLPTHLEPWMEDLELWYPFEDPFWNGPTEDFLPTLDMIMDTADQIVVEKHEPILNDIWNDPQMICWGWNVQEEEGLFIDTEIVRSNGDASICRPSRYLLCIPGARESIEASN
jgi:hypothetical protein